MTSTVESGELSASWITVVAAVAFVTSQVVGESTSEPFAKECP